MNATMVTRDARCSECQRLRTILDARQWERFERWYAPLSSGPATPHTLDRALSTLKELIPADRISVLVPVAQEKLQIVACSNQLHIGDFLISLDLYPELRYVLEKDLPLLVPDVTSNELLQPVAHLIARTQIRSIAAVPFTIAEVPAILRMTATHGRFVPADLQMIEAAAHLIEHLASSPDPAGAEESWRRLLIETTDMTADVLADGTILHLQGHPERVLGPLAGGAIGSRITKLGPFADAGCSELEQAIASTARPPFHGTVHRLSCGGLSIWIMAAGTLVPFSRLVIRSETNSAATAQEGGTSESRKQQQLQENLTRVIAELEVAQETIERLRTQQTEFVASAAHELKAPLTVAQSYLEIVTNDLADDLPKEYGSFIRIAYENVLRLKRLVKDLIDLAAIEGGQISLVIERVEIEPIITRLTSELAPLAAQRGLTLQAEIPQELPVARADSGRIAQILRNLIDNAVKYTPEHGSVTVRGRQEGDSIVVEVEDTGVGISKALLDRVFEPFYRVPQPREIHRDGSGLGLTISRRIASALGGTLSADSRPGRGTIFRLTVPRWPESFGQTDA